MTFDIVLAGVGGQGVLSLSNTLALAALDDGLYIKQSEVHGMSQRGGAVTTHLRLADAPIHSELIPLGAAAMILSLEPAESLRYLEYLRPDGIVITASEPVKNIPNYPEIEALLEDVRSLPRAIVVDAAALARKAGLAKATNMVIAGAAAPYVPITLATLERGIRTLFASKGSAALEQNLAAFRSGQEAACASIR